MASFSERLKAATSNVGNMSVDPGIAVASEDIMTLEEPFYDGLAYSGEEDNWDNIDYVTGQPFNYEVMSEYEDVNISYIDEKKTISIHPDQINLTQESNSQYIPFEMFRRYDGVDLTTKKLSIFFVNEYGDYGTAYPINVQYGTDKIRFGFLVPRDATLIAGDLNIEIHAEGTTSLGGNYLLKTRPNNEIKILESLQGNGRIIVDENWATNVLEQVQQAAKDAEKYAAQIAEDVKEVNGAITNATSTITQNVMNNIAASYYDSDEVDAELEKYALKTEIPIIPTNVSAFNNDANYATEAVVDQKIADANIEEKLGAYVKKVDLEGKLGNLVDDENAEIKLTVEQYVKQEVEKVDISDELGTLVSRKDGSKLTVEEYVRQEVENVDVTDKVYTKEEIDAEFNKYATQDYVKQEIKNVDISEKLGNLGTDADGNPVETVTQYVNLQVNPVKDNIAKINEELSTIDKSPRKTYKAVYNDTEDENCGENVFVLYEITNEDLENEEKFVKSRFPIVGGSGSGSVSLNTITISEITKSPITTTINDNLIIEYSFICTNNAGEEISGDFNAVWKVGSKTILSKKVNPGKNVADLTGLVDAGSGQWLTLWIDDGIEEAKSSNYRRWQVNMLDIKIEDYFDDTKSNTANIPVSFSYKPYGAIDKTVHFLMDKGDGKGMQEIAAVQSLKSYAGMSTSYSIPGQSHGVYPLEVYMTASVEIGGEPRTYESNHIYKEVIWFDSSETVPLIGCKTKELTIMQYDVANITFSVYDPKYEVPTVIIYDNDEEIYRPPMASNTYTYSFTSTEIGVHKIDIVCGETVKTINITVEELDIPVEPVETGLAFDFNPADKRYISEDGLWSQHSNTDNKNISMTVSENFDWINGGYQTDDMGNSYFCIKAGTTATIDYKMFCNTYNVKSIGGHYKLMFKTTNVQDASKPFLQCFKDNVGVVMQPHETNLYAGTGNKLFLTYSENDRIEFELNMGEMINEKDRMVMGYEDGVATMPLVYDNNASFVQGINDSDAEYITLGSTSCDLHIYRFKAYRRALASNEILNNFILDAPVVEKNKNEIKNRYERNQIYKEGLLDPDYLAEVCPDLRIIMISAPKFTSDKDETIGDTNVRCIYKNGRDVDNWEVTGCKHKGQGTSSNMYGAAGRNIDLVMNKKNDDGKYPTIKFSNGTTLSDGNLKLNLTETSVPINYLNIKVNIASSENANNALLAKLYNKYNPYKRPLVREEGYPYEVKDTMEFQNCVVFVQERDPNIATHREFEDTNYHFYAIGNIGDSKKTDDTRMNDPDDTKEFVVEIMDNNLPNSKFQSGVEDEKGYSITGSDIEEIWKICEEGTFEKTYSAVTDVNYLRDKNLHIFYELIDGEYIPTSDTKINSSKTYYELNYPNAAYAGMYVDKFRYDPVENKEVQVQGWDVSFECRYEHDDADHDEHVRLWNEFYKFVIFSSDEEFKENLINYCVLDSVMYYYLFTLHFTMIDNRAKNSFWHYGKCEDGKYRWDLCFDYDNDTALGINNFGKQVYRYGYEDGDYIDSELEENASSKTWVYNAATSTFYKRLKDLFGAELRALYTSLTDLWNAESTINEFDDFQEQFPEELWRLDINRKYIRTFSGSHINGKADDDFLRNKMNGRKKYHRRQFIRNQTNYMSSKFRTTTTTSNFIRLRAQVPDGNLAVPANFDLTITPFAHMYVNINIGNGLIVMSERGKPGVPITFDYPTNEGDIIQIESAFNIQSVGDLSPLYTGEAGFGTATKLKEMILGNSTEGYSNSALRSITFVDDGLLEYINIENINGLDDTGRNINLSSLSKLKTVKAKGSNITGIVLAKNGAVETLSLPALSYNLNMKNLLYLNDVDIDSLKDLTNIVIEDCNFSSIENFVIGGVSYDSPNELTFLNNAPNLQRVRLTGIDWNLPDTSVLERLYSSTIGGYNANGDETTRAYLSGRVYVPVIKQKAYEDYEALWGKDFIHYGRMIKQIPVYFKNYDGEILDIQYVDEGRKPVDPITSGRISTPTKPSDVQYDYSYTGWDSDTFSAVAIGGTYIYTAQYDSTIRTYTVKYVQPVEFNEPEPLYEVSKPYGSYVSYQGAIPTYTKPEDQGALTYYLFSGWDKTGYVDGDKIITAKYDKLTYTDGYFANKELEDMSPVEIYALTKLVLSGQLTLMQNSDASDYLGITGTNINQYDPFKFTTGHDVDYEGVEDIVLIGKGAVDETYAKPKTFSGTVGDYYDTGISLFDIDRSFVLAVDYEFASGNTSGISTLMQCIDDDYNGFKLYSGDNSNPTLMWGGTGNNYVCASGTKREMLVIRHKAGEKQLYVYVSDLDETAISTTELVGEYVPFTESSDTLVFGCAKSNNAIGSPYTAYGKGTIHWAKLWYDDLGDVTCKELAQYIHEEVRLRLCGFARHYISGTKTFPVLSFIGDRALYVQRKMNNGATNAGGWASSNLKTWLNNRFYKGIPLKIRQLIKQVEIKSTIGEKSTTYSSSNCYVYIPAFADLSTTNTGAQSAAYAVLSGEITPGKTISYMRNPADRIKMDSSGENAVQYYTRSPGYPGVASTVSDQYFYRVTTSGDFATTGLSASNAAGVVVMFSI